jgi:hypothetical protein
MHYARWRTHGDPTVVGTRRIDLTGQRVGYLIVQSLHPSTDQRTRWACLCDCGQATVVPSDKLRSGSTQSCGCRNGLPLQAHGLRRVRAIYCRNARDRGIAWALTDDDLAELVSESCFYCGATPANATSGARSFPYNGIDRIDNTIGYERANCVPCCRPCNMMKGTLDVDTFLALIRRIASQHSVEVPA